MSSNPCHVGVAIYDVLGFQHRWILVLSEHEAVEGKAWCSTTAESENGWREAWTMCISSPAAFNQIGRFMGVLHIACAEVPMQALKDTIIDFKIASEAAEPFTTNVPDLSIPESYVV